MFGGGLFYVCFGASAQLHLVSHIVTDLPEYMCAPTPTPAHSTHTNVKLGRVG